MKFVQEESFVEKLKSNSQILIPIFETILEYFWPSSTAFGNISDHFSRRILAVLAKQPTSKTFPVDPNQEKVRAFLDFNHLNRLV